MAIKIKKITKSSSPTLTVDIEVENTHSYQLDNGVVSHNSVLLMTASGVHGEHSKRYFRHVQMNKMTEVAQTLKATNPYMVEESVWSANGTDYVIAYPFISKEGSIYKKDLIGNKHLEIIKMIQENWVVEGTDLDLCVNKKTRHNVSNTVLVDDWDEVADYIYENRNSFAGVSLLSSTGDKDYPQAPNTEVLTQDEILEKYGVAAMFASGLVVAGLDAFGDLWKATSTAQGVGEDIAVETHENMRKRDWVRRFNKYAANYFNGNLKEAEYCLKDVYLLHKWVKIQSNLQDVDWTNAFNTKRLVDADTMAAASCSGVGGCEI